MLRTDTVIIGGGQAGLAMSRCLAARGIEHVVLERGRVGQRWLEHWDSLRLLTPNWQSRLPGFRYQGHDPDGFMPAREVAAYLEAYARSFAAPVYEHTTVRSLARVADRYELATDCGAIAARSVVLATGHCQDPHMPELARGLPAGILQITPASYKNPEQLPDGGVLVVGASATGVQLADEIRRSGREVTLAVGRHTRLPRRYRGRDVMWWLDRMGVLAQRISDVRDPVAAVREPSLQLVGDSAQGALDLATLQARGVRLTGRLIGVSGSRALFADDLGATTREADARLARLLDRIDAFADVSGLGAPRDAREAERAGRPVALRITAAKSPTALNLTRGGFGCVLWATGYARSYPWLRVPVLDAHGELLQRCGITRAPGLYTLGLRFQRRRNSSFLDGVGQDARELAAHVAAFLGAATRAAA